MLVVPEERELWPTEQAQALQTSLTEYLTTTFALSDQNAEDALKRLLNDPENGMFKGPYIRTRLPFVSDDDLLDANGKPKSLDYYPSAFKPYGHQAKAFARLSSKGQDGQTFRTPQPTLVTTGTGSGKTEAFLYPILDHVLRAQKAGITGLKALILYPMNALANDQAARLTELLLDEQFPELAGIRAGIYTGEEGPKRSLVTQDGLINERHELRSNPPDILLTNYKMLDQLLLRAEDAHLWNNAGVSLQYLVLDEFHTYDGAQGTDVAMLLRRLGAVLKDDAAQHTESIYAPSTQQLEQPLGKVTPVATSATMGGTLDDDGESPMLDFAKTIFGIEFTPEAVIQETRVALEQWLDVPAPSSLLVRDDQGILARLEYLVEDIAQDVDPEILIYDVIRTLFERSKVDPADPRQVEDALKHHPWIQNLIRVTENAASLATIREAVAGQQPHERHSVIEEFLSHLLAVLSHIRSHLGRESVTVETHLWVREVSRLDSPVDRNPEFLWSDDGVIQADADVIEAVDTLPAIFCRHCGKRGWAALNGHDQMSVNMNAAEIRRASVGNKSNFIIMLDAEEEATKLEASEQDYVTEPRLRFFDLDAKTIYDASVVDIEDRTDELRQLVAVKMHHGLEARDLTASDTCPNCDTPDAIRFVGSAIATLLSVAITSLFGSSQLQLAEKKALVFTDSVQDAAHRAGFIQARSHTFTLRTVLRQALEDLEHDPIHRGRNKFDLSLLIDAVMERAEQRDDADKFLLIPPDVLEHQGFIRYWDPKSTRKQHRDARTNVKRRLLFDSQLEVGLQARFGRTLELTGTIAVEADAGDTALYEIGEAALNRLTQHQVFDIPSQDPEQWRTQLTQWVRGVLIRIRLQGGIGHEWFHRYWETLGLRWPIWGGRNRAQGMPAFPLGRSAPRFPVADSRGLPQDTNFDPISTRQSWYTWWTRQAVKADREQAGHWSRALFDELVERDVLTLAPKTPNNKVYVLPPERIVVELTTDQNLHDRRHTLECDLCKAKTFGTERIIDEMTQAPCLNRRCTGRLVPVPFDGGNYYRHTLYSASRTTRVIAREHTAMLEAEERLQYEEEFRSDTIKPTSPNVLVATPTLEMGIDIGSLSTVMLSSMPRSVANYVQRVGRAGRQSGNSLIMAFVQGRGEHLPKLNEPLSIINGEVRPPATYLEADEILRRQFIAFCADILARQGSFTPGSLHNALFSVSEGTYLGAMMQLLRDDGDAIVQRFLDQFGTELSDRARDDLRSWALPDLENPESHSLLETRLHRVSALYLDDRRELETRRDTLQNIHIPDLEKSVDHSINTSGEGSDAHREAKRALGIAEGTLRSIRNSISELSTKEWWVSGLERYGLFPNYTLLDDTVELSARVSHLNEDSQTWEADVVDFARGASVALQEFAPGSTFYAQGMEFEIDAVELGPDNRHLSYWQVCPECGWTKKDLLEVIDENQIQTYQGFVTHCGRCGTNNIGDQGQILPVVDLKKVSSEVRRDEARISDRRDDRARTRFHVYGTADLDEQHQMGKWYLRDYPFGMELYSEADLHWYNFGLASVSGKSVEIAGSTLSVPLFEICLSCGVQRRKTEINDHRDHRYWCTLRSAAKANSQSVALSRHLKTQAVRIHLATELMLDDYSLPTLRAALLLGMREAFGGDPAHLKIMRIAEEQRFATQGYNTTSLLLHDTVPGGTGYLSEFANPNRVRRMLERAYETVANCACQAAEDHRLACHNCLLPYADYDDLKYVSRAVAQRVLGKLLASGNEATEPAEALAAEWRIAKTPLLQEHRTGDSPLEVRFREALKERLEAKNVKVEDTFANGYLGYNFTIHGSHRKWRLVPQEPLGNVQPDFVLRAAGTTPIAIFIDGLQFHASQQHNVIADDVRKRHSLLNRDEPYIPWAITHQDIEAFLTRHTTKAIHQQRLPWMDPIKRDGFINEHQIDRNLITAAQSSSMDLLWEWIEDPDPQRFAALADYAVYAPMFQQVITQRKKPTMLTDSLADQLTTTHLEPRLVAARLATGASEHDAWWHHDFGPVDIAAAGNLNHPDRARVILNLNDEPSSLTDTDFANRWRDWLLLATILAFRNPNRTAIVSNQSAQDILQIDIATPPTTPIVELASREELSAAWQETIDEAFEGAERDFVSQLAYEDIEVPEIGFETTSGTIIDIGWPDAKIAVLLEDFEERAVDTLQAEGWNVLVKPNPQDVVEVVKGN